MGWTEYRNPVSDPQGELDRIFTWDNADGAGRVLASRINGRDSQGREVYYAALEATDKAAGTTKVVAIITLFSRSPFGYKDMDESMGPYQTACPREILELLTPLPAPDPNPPACATCEGTGKLHGPRWHEHAQGQDCHACNGTGRQRDRHASAREWRKAAWARFGGEPQGTQLALAV